MMNPRRRTAGLVQELEALVERAQAILQRARETTIQEEAPTKPLTPAQLQKRSRRDQDKQARVRDIQDTANRRVADIRSKMGR